MANPHTAFQKSKKSKDGLKIRTRLMLIFVLVVAVGFYFLVGYILDNLRLRYLESVEETIVDEANILASLVETQIDEGEIHTDSFREAFIKVYQRTFVNQIYEFTKTHVDQQVYITDEKGKVIFDSNNGQLEGKDYSAWRDVAMTLRGQYGARATRRDPQDPDSSTLFIAAPIYYKDKIAGVLTVSKPTGSIHLFIETARPQILIAGGVTALSIILLGMAFSVWVTQPIHRLTKYARAVRDGKDMDLPYLGSSELKQMGFAFEEMKEALEGKKYVEHYIQNLTHELKSPLAAISGAAELIAEDMPREKQILFIENIQNEAKRMRAIVDRMLQIAALEVQKRLSHIEKLSLQEIISSVQKSLLTRLSSKNIKLVSDIPAQLQFEGDLFFMKQVCINLIENAIDFSPAGGKIHISAKTLSATQFELRVSDDGPGIPEFAQERVFEKFYSLPRPDSGRKSTGLGLSFVREVVRLHHGEIHMEAHHPEQEPPGCSAVITLPFHIEDTFHS